MRLVEILALCVLVALAAVTAAGAKVKITKIYYNSPGRDNGSDQHGAERTLSALCQLLDQPPPRGSGPAG
jgi:hypothetical protein